MNHFVSNKEKNRAKPKIGVFIERLVPQYNQIAWLGMAEAAQELDMHLISYVVGKVERISTPQNALYEYIDPKALDGALLLQAIELEFLDTDIAPTWLKQLGDVSIPVLRMGLPFAHGPAIVIDNYAATRQLMDHLIIEHGCQRIAFIAGFMDHLDTEVRYEIYLEKLQAHGLPVVPELVIESDYTRPSAREAMEVILDNYAGEIDAVFAANDAMALGAIELLQERGYHIPKDIAVVGFDDVIEGRYIRSPLTTVRQPIYEMGKMAMEMMHDLLQGKDCPAQIEIPTELVIRQSCGCLPQSVIQAGLDTAVSDTPVYPLALSKQWLESLKNSYLRDLQTAQSNQFLSTLNSLMEEITSAQLESTRWQNFITQLRNQFQTQIEDPQTKKRAENLWHQARVLLSDASYRSQASGIATMSLKTIDLSHVIQQISESFDFDQFRHALATQLPKSGVYKGVLTIHPNAALIEDQKDNLLPATTHLSLYFDQKKVDYFTDDEVVLDSGDLLNNILSEENPEISIVQVLFQRNKPIGFLVFFVPPSIENVYVYELLQSQISNVLMGTMLVKQIQEHAVKLEYEVARRTENLQQANAQLIKSAQELEQSNRELKVVAYVASHDLQEPLRKIQLFADRLDALYQNVLDEKGLNYLHRMQNASARMQNLIHDLLMFSRVTTRKLVLEEVDLEKVAQAILTEMLPVYQQSHSQVNIKDLPLIDADKYQMSLLFRNLISNGLKFQQVDSEPILNIQAEVVTYEKQFARIEFMDNGIGMDMKYHDRIFDAFQKLHDRSEFSGSGIGLAVCRRIVERHNGKITMQSEEGKGTTFLVELPLKQPKM